MTVNDPSSPARGLAAIAWGGTWNFIAAVSRDGEVDVVNLISGEVATVLKISGQLNTVDWNPKTNDILIGGVSDTGQAVVSVIDVSGFAGIPTPMPSPFPPHPSPAYAIDWNQDGSHFAVVTRESLTIYDSALHEIVSLAFPPDFAFVVPDIALSPDGERIFAGSKVTRAILDTATLRPVVDLTDASVLSYTAQWNRDGSAIAFRSADDRATRIYSAIDGSLIHSFSAPPTIWAVGYEGGVEWSPDNRYFARAGGDSVFILDASTGEIVHQYPFDHETILDVSWSPDSTRMAALTTDDVAPETPGSFPDPNSVNGARRNSLILFDVASGAIITNINRPIFGLTASIAWNPDGTQIAASAGYPRIYIWDANTGELLDSYQEPLYPIDSLDYSPYGGRLMLGLNTGFSLPAGLVDPNFVPISTFAQSELDGTLVFIAPAASLQRLSTLLANCATHSGTIATGMALINTGQYAQFGDWVHQQSAAFIPTVCAADLQAVALSVLNKPSSLP